MCTRGKIKIKHKIIAKFGVGLKFDLGSLLSLVMAYMVYGVSLILVV